jgi:hypothetical protein
MKEFTSGFKSLLKDKSQWVRDQNLGEKLWMISASRVQLACFSLKTHISTGSKNCQQSTPGMNRTCNMRFRKSQALLFSRLILRRRPHTWACFVLMVWGAACRRVTTSDALIVNDLT